MANDYSNLYDIDSLDDNELRELVRDQLSQQPGLDIDDITVTASEGRVVLAGRVGTDGESRIAEHVLTDVLGITNYANELFVDPIRRAESPMAIDDHLADEAERSGMLGDVAVPYSSEAEHLADVGQEDDGFGTADYQKVMEDGMSYNPPSTPTPEGMDQQAGESGEAH